MKKLLYILAVTLIVGALFIPSSFEVRSSRTETCNMCSATRITTHREVKSLIPIFSSSTVEVAGGEMSCQHWWRNPQESGKAWGVSMSKIVIPLRIVLAIGALALAATALKMK